MKKIKILSDVSVRNPVYWDEGFKYTLSADKNFLSVHKGLQEMLDILIVLYYNEPTISKTKIKGGKK